MPLHMEIPVQQIAEVQHKKLAILLFCLYFFTLQQLICCGDVHKMFMYILITMLCMNDFCVAYTHTLTHMYWETRSK